MVADELAPMMGAERQAISKLWLDYEERQSHFINSAPSI